MEHVITSAETGEMVTVPFTAAEIAAAQPDMAALRAAALAQAFTYGNAITGQVTGAYANAEVLSWDAQEREARQVLAGETLPAEALLLGLAGDRGEALAAYAQSVVDKADAFRQIARAAVFIRRRAQAVILDTAHDTPEKLAGAVAALREEVNAIAAQVLAGA